MDTTNIRVGDVYHYVDPGGSIQYNGTVKSVTATSVRLDLHRGAKPDTPYNSNYDWVSQMDWDRYMRLAAVDTLRPGFLNDYPAVGKRFQVNSGPYAGQNLYVEARSRDRGVMFSVAGRWQQDSRNPDGTRARIPWIHMPRNGVCIPAVDADVPPVERDLQPRTLAQARALPLNKDVPRNANLGWIDAGALTRTKILGYGGCCGHKIIEGFWAGVSSVSGDYGTSAEVMVAVDKMIKAHVTGCFSAILRDDQRKVYHDLLVGSGWKLVHTHSNRNHGTEHWNHLYLWTFDDADERTKAKPAEVKKGRF